MLVRRACSPSASPRVCLAERLKGPTTDLGHEAARLATHGERRRRVAEGRYRRAWPLFAAIVVTGAAGNAMERASSVRQEKGKTFLRIEGVEYGPYDEVQPPVFSADGRSWAFEYRIDGYKRFSPGFSDRHGRPGVMTISPHLFEKLYARFVNVQGRVYGPFDPTAYDPPPVHTPAGWVFRGRLAGDEWVFVGDKRYDADTNHFSPDYLTRFEIRKQGKREWLYVTPRGEKSRTLHGPFDFMDRIFAFPKSASSSKGLVPAVAFIFSVGGQRYVYERGKVHGPCWGVDHLAFSPDGSHFSFTCAVGAMVGDPVHRQFRGDHFVHLDGRLYPGHAGAATEFLPDGRLAIRYHRLLDGGGFGQATVEVLPPPPSP